MDEQQRAGELKLARLESLGTRFQISGEQLAAALQIMLSK